MAQIILFSEGLNQEGRSFTASSFDAYYAAAKAPMTISELGEGRPDGDTMIHSFENPGLGQYRLVGYKRDDTTVTEWWDVGAYFNASGETSLVYRDSVTGALLIDGNPLQPTGVVTTLSRYQDYLATGESLAPLFLVSSGSWDAGELLRTAGGAQHALLTAGDDTIVGTEFSDWIEAGAGIDAITGNAGPDHILIGRGAGSKWFRGEHTDKGVLISTKQPPSNNSKRSRTRNAYDPDVDIIQDFKKGEDTVYLEGRPSRYSLVENDTSTLIFADRMRRNLSAVIVGVRGLDREDFIAW